MSLTKGQEKGLKIALERYKNHQKYTVISGYAGVGKTFLVKRIVEEMELKDYQITYVAYTGKAAEVLRKKGNPNACTLHKLLYESHPKKTGGFIHRPKENLGITLKMIVVDECSMVPQSMVDLLLSYHIYVLFLGDPFQLPPVKKDEQNNLLDNPHIFLDEIVRQAADSEIIRLSMQIREGEFLKFYRGQDVQILPKKDLSTGMLKWANQVLVAKNETRQAINQKMRSLYGFSGLPKNGEKMICLRNYWETVNANGEVLINGTVGTIKNPFKSAVYIPPAVRVPNREVPILIGDFQEDSKDEKSTFSSIEMDLKLIQEGERCVPWDIEYKIMKLKKRYGDILPKEFDFAYALTYWKAQGSEWDKVLVIEENFPFDRQEHLKALYTACTRASNKLVLIKNY